ncbi:AraC family transcriptional regulator [Luteipulveratus halotolerans]|uniref:HTH araC/xylS-type domain-containing protein n=1 Tax=Luteipulveratus halotolerans TaxID=1631356 RepID=A0A0L6CMH3_9MICO|nr:AraC family transcriptional regulator [Luteipulveratus halotolerans]KNX38743.1 hypothetical protein VV01_18925 [Luteipulveratus halotolerans]
MAPMVRAATLRGLVPLVERLGGHPDELLDRFGIPAHALAADDGLVSVAAHNAMLEAAACEFDCPDLGLQLADAQDLGIIGPLAVAIDACDTLAEALDRVSDVMFVHNPQLRVALTADPQHEPGVIALTYRKRTEHYSPQGMEFGLGVIHRVTRALLRDDLGLQSVEIPHDPVAAPDRYDEFFGVPVRFGCDLGGLRVHERVIHAQFHRAGEAIREVASGYLAAVHALDEHPVTDQVRLAIAEALGAGSVEVASTARLLGMPQNVLRQQLAAEGTSYGRVLDDVRREEAERFITATDMSFGDVAALVGFRGSSTLSHAVRRWYGMTPHQLRDQRRAPIRGLRAV